MYVGSARWVYRCVTVVNFLFNLQMLLGTPVSFPICVEISLMFRNTKYVQA